MSEELNQKFETANNVLQLGQSRVAILNNKSPEPPKVEASSFGVNLIATGTAEWYRHNVLSMRLDVLRRHHSDFENKLQAFERGSLPLTLADRMEITESMRLLETRMDELLPKVPAAIDAHDQFCGNRIHDNWPVEAAHSTMIVHMHLCELIDAWRISPQRVSTTEITVDTFGETQAKTRFVFGSKSDAGDFIDAYFLQDFVLTEPTSLKDQNDVEYFYVELTNKFDRDDVNAFLKVYNEAILTLAVIYEERRRALSVDNGKYGYVTASHFSVRENIELNKIAQARQKLGLGFKLLNDLARK